MGCGCNGGKNTTKQATTQGVSRPVTKSPQPDGITIGPASGRTQSFTLLLDSGRTQSFGSSLEARAALTRAGGRGVIA